MKKSSSVLFRFVLFCYDREILRLILPAENEKAARLLRLLWTDPGTGGNSVISVPVSVACPRKGCAKLAFLRDGEVYRSIWTSGASMVGLLSTWWIRRGTRKGRKYAVQIAEYPAWFRTSGKGKNPSLKELPF